MLVVRVILVIFVLLATGLSAAAPAHAVSLPAGFSLQTITTPFTNKQYALTDVKYVPPATGVQAGLFAAGKDGTIAWVPDSGGSRTLGKIPGVRTTGDNGLIGLTPSNDYATSRRVYALFVKQNPGGATVTPHWGMLESWLVNSVANPTAITRERAVIDGQSTSTPWIDSGENHQVGDVLVWPDGSLFVSQGDGVKPETQTDQAFWSQDVNDPHAKILHILPNGQGAPDNPYYDSANPSSWKSRVYATGVRNGFRLWRDPNTGKLLSSIVSYRGNEQVAHIDKGNNFGWPCWDGGVKTLGYQSMTKCQTMYSSQPSVPTKALWTYPWNNVASVTGGTVYTGTSYPTQYRGKTFVGDFARRDLWMLGTNGTQLTRTPTLVGSDVGSNTAVRSCQNGDLCWTEILTGNIMRLRYTSGNQPPTADATQSVDPNTRTVTFDAAKSYDPEGGALTYSWAFGDGTTGTGQRVTHTYGTNQSYNAVLTVRDSAGATGQSTLRVFPSNALPVVKLVAPTQSSYAVGDLLQFSATSTDREDGTLPTNHGWAANMVHCTTTGTQCHVHPSTTANGSTFSVRFPDHGPDTRLEITVTSYPDSVTGLSGKATYVAVPRLRTLTVATPAGVSGTVNGSPSPQKVVAKASTFAAVPKTSSYWVFQRWADNGSTDPNRQLTMPDADLTLTAVYDTAINQRYVALGGSGSWLGSPTAAEFSVAGGRQRNYQWGSLYWSATTGVKFVKGAIRNKYNALGGPASYGFPSSDELTAPDGIGRYNTFGKDNGSIYWTSATGAWEVHGGIRKHWVSLGAQASRLRYPVSDEFTIDIGRRSNFQGGYITWNRTTGAFTTVYY